MPRTEAQLREGFERHAAPEAIQHRLNSVRRELHRLRMEESWLTRLLIRRTEERERGEWPGPPEEASHGE